MQAALLDVVRTFLALGIVLGGLALGATAVTGCSAPGEPEASDDSAEALSDGFDRNDLLSDAALRDVRAMEAADVQAFLEKTPWKTRSVLADYEENGRSAAEIFHDVATHHGLNPLTLLVRAQMEQSLVSKTTASPEKIRAIFGCGCPDGSACAPKYAGLSAQAECAAGTLERALAAAAKPTGTVSGWARGKTMKTRDGLSVTPKNAATAALYTYTPWVGEIGGGKRGVGGASLHHVVWNRFATALGYDAPKSATGTSTPGTEDPTTEDPAAKDAGSAAAADAGTAAGGDAGAKDAGSADAGRPATPAVPPSDGSEDDALVAEGNAPSSADVPPKTSRSASSGDDAERVEPYASCAAAPGSSAAARHDGMLALVVGALAFGIRRRRLDRR